MTRTKFFDEVEEICMHQTLLPATILYKSNNFYLAHTHYRENEHKMTPEEHLALAEINPELEQVSADVPLNSTNSSLLIEIDPQKLPTHRKTRCIHRHPHPARKPPRSQKKANYLQHHCRRRQQLH